MNALRTDMEVHFVHKADDGTLAVVGVMLVGGGESGLLDQVLAVAPKVEGEAHLGVANPNSLLPSGRHFYRYAGSLTTPPCSEIVTWTVMSEPEPVSYEALSAFAAVFPMDARPLQPIHRRFVLMN